MAFEDCTFEGRKQRCWVTLLPFSANGTWIDFVYGYVSLDGAKAAAEETPEPAEAEPEAAEVVEPEAEPEPEAAEVVEPEPEAAEIVEELAEDEAEPFKVPLARLDDDMDDLTARRRVRDSGTRRRTRRPEPEAEPEPEPEPEAAFEPEPEEDVLELPPEAELDDPVAAYEPEPEAEPESRPSFTAKVKESLASVGFYGKVVQSGPELPAEAFVEETSPVRGARPSRGGRSATRV